MISWGESVCPLLARRGRCRWAARDAASRLRFRVSAPGFPGNALLDAKFLLLMRNWPGRREFSNKAR